MLERLLPVEVFAFLLVFCRIGGAMLIFAALMTTVDVILRKLFNWSFGGADEIAGYMFAIFGEIGHRLSGLSLCRDSRYPSHHRGESPGHA